MAVVTPVVPPTRRNVELVLLLLAVGVAGARLRHRRPRPSTARVPQDWSAVGGGLALLVLVVHLVLRWRAPVRRPGACCRSPPCSTASAWSMIHRLDLAHRLQQVRRRSPPGSSSGARIGVACAIAVIVCVRDHRVADPLHLHRDGRRLRPAAAAAAARASARRSAAPGSGSASARCSFQPGEIAKIVPGACSSPATWSPPATRSSLVGRKFLGHAAAPRPRPRADPRRLGWRASASWCSRATSAPRCCSSACSS